MATTAKQRQRARGGRPDGALVVTAYARLQEYLQAFAQGHLNLLILVGEAGTAKTRTVRSVLNGTACWIEGNATPFGMYEKLYRHRDKFVVIDDVDSLYADRSGVRLLKCLCQTEAETFCGSRKHCSMRASRPSMSWMSISAKC